MSKYSKKTLSVLNLENELSRLWLDPKLNIKDICKKLSISRASFYRYKKKFNLKKINVAISSRAEISKKEVLNRSQSQLSYCEFADFHTAKLIGEFLNVRVNVISAGQSQLFKGIESGKIDLAINSLTSNSTTKQRFHFSNQYAFKTPGFQVYKRRDKRFSKVVRLGVSKTISGFRKHSFLNLDKNQKLKIKIYDYYSDLESALLNNLVDCIACHPTLLSSSFHNCGLIEPEGAFVKIPGHTAMIVAPNKPVFLENLNLALEELHNKDILFQLEKSCNLILDQFYNEKLNMHY